MHKLIVVAMLWAGLIVTGLIVIGRAELAYGQPEAARLLSPLSLGPFATEIALSGSPEIDASSVEVLKFEQTLVLQAYGGTTSKIMLRISEPSTLSQVRLIAVGDGLLRVAPFSWSSESQMLQAKVITPSRSFEYQFQFVFADGRGQLSKWFSLEDSCFQRVPVTELAPLPDERKALIAELVKIDRDSTRLTHALAAIQQLLEAGP